MPLNVAIDLSNQALVGLETGRGPTHMWEGDAGCLDCEAFGKFQHRN
jgi:hypothetical protein